jgi:hypothetical protein
MADVLRIKRRTGGGPGAPASLANAELAYNEVDHTLYYGEGTGGGGGSATVVVPIAGQGMGSASTPAMDGAAAAGSATTFSRGDHIHPTDTSRAPLNSPAFTGTPTAPTPTPGTDNTTKLATTAFVQSAISAVSGGVTSLAGANGISISQPSGAVTVGINANGILNASLATMAAHTYKGNNTGATATPIDVTAAQLMTDLGAAPINSPTFTGTPAGPTPSNGTNTTQLATTQYVLATRIDQLQPPNVDVPWNSKRITGLLNPTNAQDAATKAYVDSISQGLDAKGSCVVATTANIALTGAQTIDGWSVQTGDRVLVKNQTTQSENGIYTGNTIGAWARATDADTWTELVSAFTFVEQGPANADSGWLCTVDAAGTIGTTAVTWVQFSGAGQISAGNGLTKTGNVIDAVGTASRIAVFADNIDIDVNYAGQVSITTLGTITTGTWAGNLIPVLRGGTGAAALTGYVKGAGTSAFTASATIPSTDITGLGTMSVQNANAVAITGGTIDGITLDCGTF